MHPDLLDIGDITSIYQYISEKINEVGLELRWEGTAQTKQIYWKENTKVLGAIQYEGSNNFESKPPTTVSIRFYRNNLPDKLKKHLEEDLPPYRQILQTVITHKFTKYDDHTKVYIDKLCSLLYYYLN